MVQARNRDLEKKIRSLFEEEKLKSKDDLLTLFCKHLGFDYAGIPLPSRSMEYWGEGQVAELVANESFELLAQAGDVRHGGFAVIYGTLRDFGLSNQRTVILQLRKSFPDALYVFAKPQTLGREQCAQINIVHVRMRTGAEGNSASSSRLLLRRFRFGPGERYRTAAERLAKLELSALRSRTAAVITLACNEAFDKEALTNEFFKKLNNYIAAIEKDLGGGVDAFSQAQLLIERLIFLYFAQNRGWLDQKANYLVERFEPYRRDNDGFGYYHDFLHLLFHTLAEPDFGNRLPGIPFLNGGLFDDDEFRLASSKLRIRNGTFANLFDDLLEAYNFTVREDTPLSQEVAVDPEMLGKIFESIVLHAEAAGEEYQAPDKRKATGSYYTPRIVVHFICRESLRLYFAQRAGSLADPDQRDTWNERVSRLFKEIDPTDGFSGDELKALKTLLSPTEAKRSLNLLLTMRTLDPAVGSGAFPVGLLHELISLQRIFEAVAHGYHDPVTGSGTQWMQKAKEYFIQQSLFGVDIQQQAVEICRLRLWLSLLVDYELGVNPFEAERGEFISAISKISQLPNLQMHFKRGDSLQDYICGRPVRIEPGKPSQYADQLQCIEKLGAKLHRTARGATKKQLRLEILEKRIALARGIVEDEIAALKEGYIGRNWFGETLSEREQREKREREIARLQTALKQIEHDEANLRKLEQRQFDKDFYRKLHELEGSEMDAPLNFAWRIDFPRVLSGTPAATLGGEFALVNEVQGQQELTVRHPPKSDVGFDLIVGNPPFVTARNAAKRELYRERWPRVCHMKFLLVCPFFELSFSLLRPNGQLGFIVSNAFSKREFGKPLVEVFFPTVHLQKVVDCSGLLFPGHGTPTCLVFGEQREPDAKLPIRVAAILPGGGDLRTPPEDSPLWHTLAAQHDNPGFSSQLVVVAPRDRKAMSRWPWNFDVGPEPTRKLVEAHDANRLRNFLATDVGFMFIIGRNDIFMLQAQTLRLNKIAPSSVRCIYPGEEIRDFSLRGQEFVIFPYEQSSLKLVKFPKQSAERRYFDLFSEELSERPTFAGTFADEGKEPYEFHQLPIERAKNPCSVAFPEISTHGHFVFDQDGCAFHQKSPLLKLKYGASADEHHLIAGLLNSSSALFWLKQVCFNKGAGEAEHRDRFEYAGGKVQQLPVPGAFAAALRGKANALTERLTALSRACWERGRELSSLALCKLFEKCGEAFHDWNAMLPGYVVPHAKLGAPFFPAGQLRDCFARAQTIRDALSAEMIARQEEMDWLVYAAYGLIGLDDPTAQAEIEPAPLDQSQRPFRLWHAAEHDFVRAVNLIPGDWPKARHALWEARLAAIRDNEHIRRLEQPVYKRRWDEQWKVGNRWMAGPVAYAQEFIDAFRWWLSEKSEWYLEHKARGGPIALADWSAALFKDARVAAAWEVASDAVFTLERFKFDSLDPEKKETKRPPKLDDSYTAFERFFRELVTEQSVPHGLPPAKPWNELAEPKKWTPAQLNKAKAVRGKLNVPRERFQIGSAGEYLWAGTNS